MAKEYRKGIYTLNEISAEAIKKYPGRWSTQESAYAAVKTAAQRQAVGDINGKKKYKQIAAVDAARIFEELEKTNTRKKKAGHGQADLFELLPEPVTLTNKSADELAATFSYKKPAPAQIMQPVETAAELYQTADELARAFCNFALALKSFTQGA